MEIFSASLAICARNSPFPGEFPTQRPVTRSFDDFDLRLNKRLSKQSSGWWFETLSCPIWRYCDVNAGSRASYGPYHWLGLPNHGMNIDTNLFEITLQFSFENIFASLFIIIKRGYLPKITL